MVDYDLIIGLITGVGLIFGLYNLYKIIMGNTKQDLSEETEEDNEDDEDDDYDNDEEDDEDNDEEESENECIICGKSNRREDVVSWDSDDCNDYSDYERLVICKECIDRAYPREKEIEYKDRFIEKPADKVTRKYSSDKSKFD